MWKRICMILNICMCVLDFVHHYLQLFVLLHVHWSICPLDVTSENVSLGSVKPTTTVATMTTTMKLSLSHETTSSSKHVYCKPRCWSPVLPLVAWESSSWLLCLNFVMQAPLFQTLSCTRSWRDLALVMVNSNFGMAVMPVSSLRNFHFGSCICIQ